MEPNSHGDSDEIWNKVFVVTFHVTFSSRGQQLYSYAPGCILTNFLNTIFVFSSFENSGTTEYLPFYYASIRSLSFQHTFSGCFFDIGSAISGCGTMIERYYSGRKWGEGGKQRCCERQGKGGGWILKICRQELAWGYEECDWIDVSFFFRY